MASIAPERRHPSIHPLGDSSMPPWRWARTCSPRGRARHACGNRPCATGCGRTGTSPIPDHGSHPRVRHHGAPAAGPQAGRGLEAERGRLRPLIALFVAGTAPLADAAASSAIPTHAIRLCRRALTFLRGRGLLAADAAGLEGLPRLAVGEDYLIAAASGWALCWTSSPRSLTRSTCCSTFTRCCGRGSRLPYPGAGRHAAEPGPVA